MAERTRSRDSFTAASGRPTMLKAGRPPERCTSTSTGGAATPSRARLKILARLMRTLPVRESGESSQNAIRRKRKARPPCRACTGEESVRAFGERAERGAASLARRADEQPQHEPGHAEHADAEDHVARHAHPHQDRKSTRLNSSH